MVTNFMEDVFMKFLNYGATVTIALSLVSCAMFKSPPTPKTSQSAAQQIPQQQTVQVVNQNQAALEKANKFASGWPDSSINAAKEIIAKCGDPHETTSDSLIWRNVAPFKKIIVHREVYSHKFPLLHQNSLEHVVDYRADVSKVDDVWRYNGSIVLDRTKGEMSSFANSEAMNILGLNLAHDVLTGRMSADSARITFGKETMNFLNGNKTAQTSVLRFGHQFQTADPGESVTNKIRWIEDPSLQKRSAGRDLETRQAQEEKKK